MKIHGVEGLSPQTIRDEVGRGGRFVIYTYCVSVLVMTFKRPTGVYFIKPGASAAVKGWPFIVVSFLFGWWGFPWGPVYTIQTIYQSLCGGIDVTDDLMRQLAPAPASSTAAPAPQPPSSGTVAAPAAPRGFNFRVAVVMLAAVCVVVLLAIGGYCYNKQTHLPVVLVSGLATPYTVLLNGEPHTLKPFDAQLLTMPEGQFTIQDAPGSNVVGRSRTVDFELPFLDHLGTDKVAVLNPDGLAVLANLEVPYYADGTTPPKNTDQNFALFVNKDSYFIDKPDFVLEVAPERIDVPSGTTRVIKHRLQNIANPELPWVLDQIKEKAGYPAAREYTMNLAARRTDEDLLRAAFLTLKPADVLEFFKLHLDDRPVLVEWHRYYQQRMSQLFPNRDLVGEYRARLASDPGNGAYCYLLGRLVPDHDEESALWKRALAANPPCYHAYNGIAFDAMCAGNFEEAVAFYDEALKSGLSSTALTHYRRQAMIAAGRAFQALAEIDSERKANPMDLNLAEEEINVAFAASHNVDDAMKLRDDYLTAYRKLRPPAEYLHNAESVLGAAVAYLAGDEAGYARDLSSLAYPFYQFRAALTTGDTARAASVSDKNSPDDVDANLLLYIAAKRSGAADLAEAHFSAALKAMARGTPDERAVATLLESERPDPTPICDARIEAESKRILLTAMGIRFPADKDTYFPLARKFNFNPQFPHLLLQAATGT